MSHFTTKCPECMRTVSVRLDHFAKIGDNFAASCGRGHRFNALFEGLQDQFPQYRAHKIVSALKIKRIMLGHDTATEITLYFDDDRFAPMSLGPSESERIDSAIGVAVDDMGYLVVYSDGYRSWSPTKAFEEGYSEVVNVTS